MAISSSLRRAAKLQEKIEGLRLQLAGLLDRARAELASGAVDEVAQLLRGSGRNKSATVNGRRAPGKKAPKVAARPARGTVKSVPAGKKQEMTRGPVKRRKRSPLLGVKRAASPTGPLAPAVVKVLKTKNRPMNVADILSGLHANGYRFNSAEPKKNLAARIYRLKGVRQASAGLFEVA